MKSVSYHYERGNFDFEALLNNNTLTLCLLYKPKFERWKSSFAFDELP